MGGVVLEAPIWEEVSAERPCPRCAAKRGCSVLADGEFVRCLSELAQAREELEAAYHDLQRVAAGKRDLVPAEEWLLDNFHIVEEQLREIEEDLPVSYLAELPRLADGRLAGRPRVYAIAVDFIAHTDARLDRENLVRYVEGYQE